MARKSGEDGGDRGMFLRTRGYFAKKIRVTGLEENARTVISEGKDGALRSIRPRKAELGDLKTGYTGRYADGGRARFAEMARDRRLDQAGLGQIRADHLKFRTTYAAFGVFCLLAGMASVAFSGTMVTILGGGVFALFAFVFAALAMRADYAAWQIGQRRFGGFRDYLDNRNAPPVTGSNLQAAPARQAGSRGPKAGG